MPETIAPAPSVYVVTLAWNQREDTLACLESLSQMTYPNFHLLLVDNASTDGTVSATREKFPSVEIISNPRNLGFAAGCNVGLRHALEHGAEFILLINNDTLVDPEALTYLMAEARTDIGILSPKIYYAADPTRIWSVGGMRHPLTSEITDDARGQIDVGQWEQTLERENFAGCAMLFSRRLLTEVGLFDEGFFMYYEDMDLARRTRLAGFRLLMVPQSKIWHKVALSSGGSDSPNERYWMARSSVRFFRKHVHGWRWLIVLPYRSGSAIKTLLRLVAHNKWPSARAYLTGLRDGITEAVQR